MFQSLFRHGLLYLLIGDRLAIYAREMLISALIQEKKTELNLPGWADLDVQTVRMIRRRVRILMYADNVCMVVRTWNDVAGKDANRAVKAMEAAGRRAKILFTKKHVAGKNNEGSTAKAAAGGGGSSPIPSGSAAQNQKVLDEIEKNDAYSESMYWFTGATADAGKLKLMQIVVRARSLTTYVFGIVENFVAELYAGTRGIPSGFFIIRVVPTGGFDFVLGMLPESRFFFPFWSELHHRNRTLVHDLPCRFGSLSTKLATDPPAGSRAYWAGIVGGYDIKAINGTAFEGFLGGKDQAAAIDPIKYLVDNYNDVPDLEIQFGGRGYSCEQCMPSLSCTTCLPDRRSVRVCPFVRLTFSLVNVDYEELVPPNRVRTQQPSRFERLQGFKDLVENSIKSVLRSYTKNADGKILIAPRQIVVHYARGSTLVVVSVLTENLEEMDFVAEKLAIGKAYKMEEEIATLIGQSNGQFFVSNFPIVIRNFDFIVGDAVAPGVVVPDFVSEEVAGVPTLLLVFSERAEVGVRSVSARLAVWNAAAGNDTEALEEMTSIRSAVSSTEFVLEVMVSEWREDNRTNSSGDGSSVVASNTSVFVWTASPELLTCRANSTLTQPIPITSSSAPETTVVFSRPNGVDTPPKSRYTVFACEFESSHAPGSVVTLSLADGDFVDHAGNEYLASSAAASSSSTSTGRTYQTTFAANCEETGRCAPPRNSTTLAHGESCAIFCPPGETPTPPQALCWNGTLVARCLKTCSIREIVDYVELNPRFYAVTK